MAEPTLSLALKDLRAKVGVFAGWGRGADFGDNAYTNQQAAAIDDSCQSGLRRFYWPEPIPPDTTSYDWSFLKPLATFDFPANAQVVLLPEDYGGVDGEVTLLTTNVTAMPWRIEWRNEGQIREMYSVTPQMIGPPMYCAIQPFKGTTALGGQRFQLFLFPTSDMDYTLQFTYYLNPDYLTTASPYAYGGTQHIETILESCLSVFEERWDDTQDTHRRAFAARLAASISMDRRNRPQLMGYNRDNSDRREWERKDVHYWAPAATYNGQGFS